MKFFLFLTVGLSSMICFGSSAVTSAQERFYDKMKYEVERYKKVIGDEIKRAMQKGDLGMLEDLKQKLEDLEMQTDPLFRECQLSGLKKRIAGKRFIFGKRGGKTVGGSVLFSSSGKISGDVRFDKGRWEIHGGGTLQIYNESGAALFKFKYSKGFDDKLLFDGPKLMFLKER